MSLIVVLGTPGENTELIANQLAHLSSARVMIVYERPVPNYRLALNRVKRLGWLTVAGQVLFSLTVARLLESQSATRIREIRNRMGRTTIPLETYSVDSVNSDEARELLCRLNPALIVLSGTRIVSQKTLSCIAARFFNIHAGITPAYRGCHGAYWALAEGRKELAGVTVHLVDPGIDTGDILGQAKIEVQPGDNYATYPLLQLEQGLPMLLKCAEAELSGRPSPTFRRDDLNSVLYHHPTLWGYLWVRLTRGIG